MFDGKNRTALAFGFENGGKVSVAYFDNANIEGEDAKYLTGEADYRVSGEQLIISGLPSAVGTDSLTFTIDGTALFYNGTELDQENELSLDIPFAHFNS